MSAAQPIPFALPFTHYAKLGYQPIPVGWNSKIPSGGEGWNTCTYDYEALDEGQHSVGLLCNNIVGIDIDITDKRLAERIESVCRKALGLPKSSPRRIGKAPKRLLVARVNDPINSFDLLHKEAGVRGRGTTLFQLLGHGKQFVIHGLHPDTGLPYKLDKPLPKWSKLPLVTVEQILDMRVQVGEALIEAGYDITGTRGGSAKVTGSFSHTRWTSTAEFDNVVMALRRINPELPRGEWFKVACALHDGTHGDEDGFDLFHAWSSGELRGAPVAAPKYKGQADCWRLWRGLKPGKGINTGTLFHMAQSGEWPTDAPQEPVVLLDDAGEPMQGSLEIARDFTDLLTHEYAPCVAIIEGLLYPKGFTMFYGKQKEGKSFALTQVATAVAAGAPLWSQASDSEAKGKPFEGFVPRRPENVLMLCAEDHGARLQKRFAELLREGVLPMPRAKLKLMLREDIARLADAYAVDDGDGGHAIPEGQGTQIIEALLREWAAAGIRVVMLDTVDTIEAMFNVTHKGKDVKRREYQQGTFYDTLADELGIAIVGTGHLRKGKGKADAEMDAMDLVNTTGAANAGISHFWAFTKLPDHCRTMDEGDNGKERRFFATGREIERDPSLHFKQGVAGMGGLWVNYGHVTAHELGVKASEYLTALEALLRESGGKPVTAEAVAKSCGAKPNTVLVFLKRFAAKGLEWKNGQRLQSIRGASGGWVLR